MVAPGGNPKSRFRRAGEHGRFILPRVGRQCGVHGSETARPGWLVVGPGAPHEGPPADHTATGPPSSIAAEMELCRSECYVRHAGRFGAMGQTGCSPWPRRGTATGCGRTHGLTAEGQVASGSSTSRMTVRFSPLAMHCTRRVRTAASPCRGNAGYARRRPAGIQARARVRPDVGVDCWVCGPPGPVTQPSVLVAPGPVPSGGAVGGPGRDAPLAWGKPDVPAGRCVARRGWQDGQAVGAPAGWPGRLAAAGPRSAPARGASSDLRKFSKAPARSAASRPAGNGRGPGPDIARRPWDQGLPLFC